MWALSQLSPTHPQLRLFTLQLFLDFGTIFFPKWPLIFLVITIHQVIWPNPGTLGAGATTRVPRLGQITW